MLDRLKCSPLHGPALRWRGRSRAGASLLELLVAFTLLSGGLTVSTSLLVRHGRLLAEYRDYQCALEELSNQIDRLTALPSAELPVALTQLRPSEFAAAKLAGAELKGDLETVEMGQRLTVRLSWGDPQRRKAPVSLASWILPTANEGNAAPNAEAKP